MPALGLKPDWAGWNDLAVRVSSLPKWTTIRDLTNYFESHGRVVYIEISEPKGDFVTALVRFSPPPLTAFWNDRMMISIGNLTRRIRAVMLSRRDPEMVATPEGQIYPARLSIQPSSLQFGLLSEPDKFMAMRTVENTLRDEFSFLVDLKARRIDITFTCFIEDPRRTDSNISHHSNIGEKERLSVYRARIFFPQLKNLVILDEGESAFSLLIPLESPPVLYKRGNQERSLSQVKKAWSESDLWNRAVGIVYDKSWFKDAPASLRADNHFVDIGRCTTYKITFAKSAANASVWDTMKPALLDFNIPIRDVAAGSLLTVAATKSNFWETLEPDATAAALLAATAVHLPFDVGYQLRVCISQGYFDVSNLGPEFLRC